MRGRVVLFLGLIFFETGWVHAQTPRFYVGVDVESLHRKIVQDEVSFSGQNFPGEDVTLSSTRLLAQIGVRLADGFSLYGQIGGSTLQMDDFGFHSDLSGAYGGGGRLDLYHDPTHQVRFFSDYRFLRSRGSDTVHFAPEADLDGDGQIGPGEVLSDERLRETLRWDEHVLRLGVEGRHGAFDPYGGIRLSFVRGRDHIPSQRQPLDIRFRQHRAFGLFLGTAYTLAQKATLFVEGSLLDAYAVSVGLRTGF